MKFFYFFILLMIVCITANAQTWTGSSGTNWNTASNWNPITVPGSNDIATIPAGATNYPVLTNNILVRSIDMQAGSQIDVNGFNITINSNYDVRFTGATINNSNAATDIVLNIATGNNGYTTYFKNNIVNDAIIFNISGFNTFLDGDAGTVNQFNGDVTYNITGTLVVDISHIIPSQFNGNLTVNRTVKGETHVCNGGGNIAGDYTFTDNTGSIIFMGNNNAKTSIAGTVNVAATDPSPGTTTAFFEMHRIINQTTGGNITVQNTAGFFLEKDTLKITSLNMTGYRGNVNGQASNNDITGTINFSNNPIPLGNASTYFTNNLFAGNVTITKNAVGYPLYESGNHYTGNVVFNCDGSGPVQICYSASSQFDGNVTINRTIAGYTEAFTYGAVINGNFSYTNNTAGDTHLGNFFDFTNRKTIISGTVNITAHYITPDVFAMDEIMNQTGGGNIDVLNSKGFNIKKDTLLVNSFSVTGYSNLFAQFFNNAITGNVTIGDDAGNNGGFYTDMRNNTITGDCNFSNNANSALFDAYNPGSSDYHNKYNGNVTYTRTNGDIYIGIGGSSANTNEYCQNFTINSANNILIGKIKFICTGNSIIEQLGTQPIVVEQLVIEKTGAGKITLNDPVTISGNVTFISGIIYSSTTNSLTFANNATQTGASAASYLDGPVTKIGNTAFVFPVGKPGAYAPISISAPLNLTDAFRAQYFTTDPSGSGYNTSLKDVSLNHLSSSEYWILDRTVGSSSVSVTLSWDASRSGTVNNIPDLRVARWNGSLWKDEGNSQTTGTNTSGTITSLGAVTNFSPFTLASATLLNPLPVNLLSFTATRCNTDVCLLWITANEINFSHYEIEKSIDGRNFNGFYSIPAKNNAVQNSYISTDVNATGNIIFYRLKMVDINGMVKYSDIIKVTLDKPQLVTLSPNPANHFIILKDVNNYHTVRIIDVTGKLQQQKSIVKNTEEINVSRLAAGIYLVELTGNTGRVTIKFVKQ
ncbi:T9SS type A sorting domain-containing protein [Ferruginibacter sp. SUN106]|uniref:T9SS type A sorting domain-containing protein n=1 Tax=Ferruginibacter sp. SUN106 TaxID=2978348 RepID=UPI003D367553